MTTKQDLHERILDLTSELVDETKSYELEQKSYDPRPQEDRARRSITYILLAILAVILSWGMYAITCNLNNTTAKDAIVEVLHMVLSPIVALVSAATGFYFGSHNK